jgi:hypothetical protein
MLEMVCSVFLFFAANTLSPLENRIKKWLACFEGGAGWLEDAGEKNRKRINYISSFFLSCYLFNINNNYYYYILTIDKSKTLISTTHCKLQYNTLAPVTNRTTFQIFDAVPASISIKSCLYSETLTTIENSITYSSADSVFSRLGTTIRCATAAPLHPFIHRFITFNDKSSLGTINAC